MQTLMLGMGVRIGFLALKSHLLLMLVLNVSQHLLFLVLLSGEFA